MSYRFCTLYSGSTGNAAYLETPSARILIDAGKCARTLVSSLASVGVTPDTLDAVVVTHDHSDHIAALEVLTKKHQLPVHMLYDCARVWERTQPLPLLNCLYLYREPGFSFTVGGVCVTSFATPHDSRGSVGYRFDFTDDGTPVSVGCATDIGYVSPAVHDALLGCGTVMLESNHDEDLLMMGPYPYDLKLRIKSKRGHLSNAACADFAAELCAAGTKNLLLAHLSEQNNYPDFAYDTTASVLAGLDVNLRVASPNDVTMLVGDRCRPVPKTARAAEVGV